MAPPVTEKQRRYASKVSFRMRKESLKKKARELSVLCDADACLLILGPDGKYETWPENSSDVMSIIRRAKSCDGKKKALSSLDPRFTLGSVGSLSSIDSNDSWLDGLSAESLHYFRESLLEKIKAAKNRAEPLEVMNEQEIWDVCGEIISLDDEKSGELAQTVSGGSCFNAINTSVSGGNFQPSIEFWPICNGAVSSINHFHPQLPINEYQVAADEQVLFMMSEPILRPCNGGFNQFRQRVEPTMAEPFLWPNNGRFYQSWPLPHFDF